MSNEIIRTWHNPRTGAITHTRPSWDAPTEKAGFDLAEVNRNIFRDTIARKQFCRLCDKALDYRTACIISGTGIETICCLKHITAERAERCKRDGLRIRTYDVEG